MSQLEIGTLPQWLLFLAVTVLGLYVRWMLGAGKLAIDAKQVEVNAENVIREHMSGELQSLRNQLIKMGEHHLSREREIDDRWRKLLGESEARHEECTRQREELAIKVRNVEQRQIAQVRQFIAYQRSIINILPDNLKTAEMMQALDALKIEEEAA